MSNIDPIRFKIQLEVQKEKLKNADQRFRHQEQILAKAYKDLGQYDGSCRNCIHCSRSYDNFAGPGWRKHMRKRGALSGLTLFSITLMIITIILALFTSLISTNTKQPEAFLTVIYGILIFAVVVSLGFSVIQFYIARTSKRTIQTDTEKIEIELNPGILLKEQIKNDLRSIIEEVGQIQESIDNQTELEISKDVSSDIDETLRMLSINPRAALLLLSTKLEDRLKSQLQEANLQSDTNYVSPRLAIDLAEKADLLSRETSSTFRDFLSVRNKVAHDAAFDVDEPTIFTLVSIGIELLKIVSAKKRRNTELPVSNADMES